MLKRSGCCRTRRAAGTSRRGERPATDGERPPGSAILYLLAAGERSHWHRLDAAEVWQFSAGEALELRIWCPGTRPSSAIARSGVGAGDAAQAVVPAGAWQTARPLGAWTLVGCIVAPAFEFAGSELAPDRLGARRS